MRDFVPREYQFDLRCPRPSARVPICLFFLSHLTLAFKVRRGGEDGDALVHCPFADPQVVIDPFLQARCFCELFWLNTGTVPSPEGERVYVSATFYVLFGVVEWSGAMFVGMGCGLWLWSTAGETGEGFRVFARGGRSGPT